MSQPVSMPDASEFPDWSFGPEQDLHCPECNVVLRGVNWIMKPPPDKPKTTNREEFTNQGMTLFPCGHTLDSPPWVLDNTGRKGALTLRQVTE